MKAITIKNPWAWAIVRGGKNVENRTQAGTWRPALHSRVAIHAGRQWSTRGAQSPLMVKEFSPWLTGWQIQREPARRIDPAEHPDKFVFGAIIGTAYLDDVHASDQCPDPLTCYPWGERSYEQADGRVRAGVVHLVLTARFPIREPIECRGWQGLWEVPAAVAKRLGGAG